MIGGGRMLYVVIGFFILVGLIFIISNLKNTYTEEVDLQFTPWFRYRAKNKEKRSQSPAKRNERKSDKH